MRIWNPNDTTIQGGPGGYVRVTLPGFGDCYARLNACADKTYLWDVWASVLGWHRGDNKIFWGEISEEARERLWTTLDEDMKIEAIRVLGRDPYPAAKQSAGNIHEGLVSELQAQ